MGVKERLPEDFVAALTRTTRFERIKDRFRFFGSVFALVRNHFSLGRQIRRFYGGWTLPWGSSRPDLEDRHRRTGGLLPRPGAELLTRWDRRWSTTSSP